MSHTPGPWVIRRRMYDYAIDSAVGLICGIHTTKRNNSEADARLIAAAPELLAVCFRAYTEILKSGPLKPEEAMPGTYPHQLMLAIAKATGGGE